uniref:Uncharacterized protein n=1 Tax=Pseudomonas phage vB_PaeS_FBPa53 TaxID=3231242 RepID=A0AAU8KXH9_9VIRU
MRMRLGYLPSHLKKYRPQAPSKAQRRNSSDPPALRLLHFLQFRSTSPDKSPGPPAQGGDRRPFLLFGGRPGV